MAFSRKSTLAAVAGSLSLAMLTGCPAAPTTTPTPSPTATAPTSPSPTGQPSAEPTEPGATPTTTPSATPLENTTIRGTVYDLDGARVDGAKVTVKSLNPSSPFESTVDVINGTYVVNSVPAGVQLEVTASKDGWTSRSRVETLLPLTASDEPNVVNFGGVQGATTGDTEGRAYFISKYPEIAMVEPAEDASNVDPSTLTVKLTLSEPLNTTNQRRFEDAIRVLPANSFAVPAGNASNTPTDLEDVATTAALVSGYAYSIAENSTFLGDDDTRATVEWSEEGKVATLTFNAPLLAAEDDAAKYQIVMTSPGAVIEDADGNDFGVFNGSFGGYANATNTILGGVFKETDLAAPSSVANGVPLWLATHTAASTFEVAEDDTTPTLTGVTVTELTGSTRITFTFNEPIAAFGGGNNAAYGETWMGATNITTASVLDNFTFAVGESASDLDDVELDGDSPATYAVDNASGVGNDAGEREREFYFVPGGSTISLGVNPDDAKQLRMTLGQANVFANQVNAIKARVEGVEDPAGNAITDTQADANVVTGSI